MPNVLISQLQPIFVQKAWIIVAIEIDSILQAFQGVGFD